MTDALHVLVSGRVQGVGFRYATRVEALRLGLCGWVKNLADGKVEAWFEGEKPLLEEMLVWCATGPGWASVTQVHHEWSRGEKRCETFEIRG